MSNNLLEELKALDSDEYSNSIIFNKDNEAFLFYKNRLVRMGRGVASEISFHELADAVKRKYGMDVELPMEEVLSDAHKKAVAIGFECYATAEIRRIALFVVDHRDGILEREQKIDLDSHIRALFDALDALKGIDPDNDWNILCNDEILERERYEKTKKLGSRDPN